MLIALTGPAGCGKSTVAAHLERDHGFARHRFAGPLKAMMRALGLTEREIEGDLKERPCELLGGKTPRWAMVSLGTEWGRDLIDSGLWVRAWQASRPEGRVVVEDCRFPNEAQMVRSSGGIIIEIVRPGIKRSEHVSEIGCGEPDYYLFNDGAAQDLLVRADAALGQLIVAAA